MEGTAVNSGYWLYRGLRQEHRTNGIALAANGSLAGLANGVHATPAMLDRVMNWVVGVLLTVGVTALVVIQAHPPQ
jgi:hypothetical protein